MPSSSAAHLRARTRSRRSPDLFKKPVNLLAPVPPPLPPSDSPPSPPPLTTTEDYSPAPSSNAPLIGASVVFAAGAQAAMVVPEQGQPPLLSVKSQAADHASPYGTSAHGSKAAAAAAAPGGAGQQSVLFGPGGQETVGEPSSLPATAEDEPDLEMDPVPSPPAKTPATVVPPSSPTVSPTAPTQAPSIPATVATSAVDTTPATSPPAQRTTLTASPTTVAASPSVVVETSIVQGTSIVSVVEGITIVSTASPSVVSQVAASNQPSSIHPSLSYSVPASASASASATIVAAEAAHRHPSAAFIIVATLGSLVLLATLATSLSWVLSYRRTGKSPFPCCGPRSRSSEISYDDDASEAYTYDIPESRRTSPGSLNEKFFSSGGTPLQADDPYTLAAAGGAGATAGGMLEKRLSIKRGIAESELEHGWDPNAQTYAGGRQNRTFQDPANGRHSTPSLYAGSVKSLSMDPASAAVAAPAPKPALGARNPFANPPMMTPSSPAVTSTLSDGPYPNPRPLPGGLMVTNLVPGDMTEAEEQLSSHPSSGTGLPPGWRPAPGGGYETDSGEIYGTPRLGDQSRPRFLSLGRDGGLDVPWAVHAGDQMDDDYATFPSRPASSASTLGGVYPGAAPLPDALQPAATTLPLHHPPGSYQVAPPTPFPDPSSEGWATTLRTNLLAAITTVTGRAGTAPPPLPTTHGLGIEPGAGVMRSTSAASSTWSRSSAGGAGGEQDRFTPRFAGRTARGGSRRVVPGTILDGVREESSAGEQLVSPFSRSGSQQSCSTYNPRPHFTPRAPALQQPSLSQASSMYSIAAPPPPTRSSNSKRSQRSARGGGVEMLGAVSSEDGSTWNGLGGRSEGER